MLACEVMRKSKSVEEENVLVVREIERGIITLFHSIARRDKRRRD